MSEQQFESREALEQHFAERLRAAGEDQSAQLEVRAARGDALASWNDRQEQAQQQREWRTQLASEFPYADQSQIQGATLEEMRAAAERSHTHVQTTIQNREAELERQRQQQAADLETRARSAYGPGASVPEGGAPPNQPDDLARTSQTLQTELAKNTGLTTRQPFDLRESYAEAEDKIFGAIAERQATAQGKRMSGGRA